MSDLNKILSETESGPTDSIQYLFAKLQLEQSQICKQNAMEYIERVEKLQEEQKTVADYISRARALQVEAKSSGKSTLMPADMKSYMDQNSLTYDTTDKDDVHTAEEWSVAIASLQSRQEELGAEVQTQMVYIQDFMGQYNSYLQGANEQIAQSQQTLTSLARGQSLFSVYGSAGAAPVATSLLLGVLLGMFSMWCIQHFRKGGKTE